jgi:hypothetical protein
VIKGKRKEEKKTKEMMITASNSYFNVIGIVSSTALRLALGPTQPPIQWVPVAFPGGGGTKAAGA